MNRDKNEALGAGSDSSENLSASSGGGAMPIPDITKISPYREEPARPAHAENGDTSGIPPRIAGEGDDNGGSPSSQPSGQPSLSNDPKPADIPDSPPGTPPSDGLPGDNPRIEDPQLQVGPTSKEDAEKTFQTIVKGYNYNIEQHLPKLISIKIPKQEISELRNIHPIAAGNIVAFVDNFNKQNLEHVKLSQQEIDMLHDDAVEVLQQSGTVFTAKERLIFALIEIGGKKIEVILKIVLSKKRLNREIHEEISRAKNELFASAEEIRAMSADLQKQIDELKDLKQRERFQQPYTNNVTSPAPDQELSPELVKKAEDVYQKVAA